MIERRDAICRDQQQEFADGVQIAYLAPCMQSQIAEFCFNDYRQEKAFLNGYKIRF